VELSEAVRRFAESPVAHLASVRADGAPHIVPVVFALDGATIVTVVDEKPKRARNLRRIENVASEPRVSVLVDHYDEDWRRLWWVRADGRGRIVHEGPELDRAIELITARYPQERARPPRGPALLIDVERWRFWAG